MKVISTAKGFILHFSNLEEIRNFSDQMSGQLKWINRNDIKPPYLWSLYSNEIVTKKEWLKQLDEIKESLK